MLITLHESKKASKIDFRKKLSLRSNLLIFALCVFFNINAFSQAAPCIPDLICPAEVTMNTDPDVCTSVVCFPVSVNDTCVGNTAPITIPSNPELLYIGSFGGHSYFTIAEADVGNYRSWEDANVIANQVGGYLTSIESQAEQDFLNAALPLPFLDGRYLIGLRYSPSLDAFKWVNGEPLNYTNWGPNQPGNTILNGDYVFYLEAGFFSGADLGWYNGIGLLPAKYIVEIEQVPIQLTSGLPSGSIFPIGTTTVSYTATDISGETATCSFDVTVLDGQEPDITCPNDTIFDLPVLTCDTIVVFDPATAVDNCDIPIVLQTDITGFISGDAFPIGVTTIEFTATDIAGNSAACTFDITVNDFDPENVACINVNVSLNENCEGEIIPEMVLVGDTIGCPDNYIINILDEYDNILSPIADDTYIGKTLRYTIDQEAQNFSCWGDVLVEDKFDPQIMCRNDTMSCGDYMMNPYPIVVENCSDWDLVMLNEVIQDVQCEDAEISKRIVRTFMAVDAAGNESPECNDTLFLRKFDVNSVVMPAFEQTITCTNGFPIDAYGNPDPLVYGVPTYDGAPLYPNQLVICNTVVHYSDVTVFETPCLIKIQRTWTVTTWYCGVDDTRISTQLFTIKDKKEPLVSCAPDFTINSDPGLECSGSTVLPAPQFINDCNETTYTVEYRLADTQGQPMGEFTDEGVTYNQATGLYFVSGLPAGTSWIRYTVTDMCGNSTECFMEITVVDDKDPVAICEHFTVVSIPADGTAQVYAESFDDGSFDDCALDYVEVARMEDNCGISGTDFGEFVEFCCDDIGNDVMVRLRVWDEASNSNECMVITEVQDKIDPVLIPLPDITVTCTYDFDPENLSVFGVIAKDEAERTEILLPAGTQFETGVSGYDGLVLDNCEMTIVEMLPDLSNMNNCGLGFVYRQFLITDANGNEIFTDQYIEINNPDPFEEADIDWPDPYEVFNICDEEELLPEMLPPHAREPVFTEDECDLVGVTYTDERFDIGLNGACFKIIRHWKVIDWCQLVSSEFPIWTYDQVIKVTNTIDPVITGATGQNEVVCTYDVNCDEGGFIELIASGTDDCTIEEDLFWTYMLDLNDDGQEIIEGLGNDASGVYDVGVHRIIWRMEDKCGNVANNPLEYTFEIRNCKAPTAYCISGLSTDIEPMDTDNDLIEDAEMAIVTPEMFDAGSNHVCGYAVTLSFSADVNDTERVFDCDDLGEQPIELWVTDINGNQSYCSTYVIVEDNNTSDICDGAMVTADVSGRIYTETDIHVTGVEIALEGSEMPNQVTNDQGSYSFPEMDAGGDYEVIPSRNTDHTEGVSTLDLVLIQKHILGLSELEGPYNRIAADINANGNISATDLVQLRKLILGTFSEFPNNTSWRFVDEDYEFPDPTNPWMEEFPENYTINDLSSDMIIDFIAVKTGDVNGSIEAGLHSSVIRSDETMKFSIESVNLEAGLVQELVVRSVENQRLAGVQFTLEFDPQLFELIGLEGNAFAINESNYSTHRVAEGSISFSYNENGVKEIMADSELFTIKLMSRKTGSLIVGQDISFSDKITKSEAYSQRGTNVHTMGLDLVERNSTGLTGFDLYQNVPNPWTNNTSIGFDLPNDGQVGLRVLDVTGRLLLETTKYFHAGYNEFSINGSELPANGILYYEVTTGTETMKAKMLRLE